MDDVGRIIKKTKREGFLPSDMADQSGLDSPLPIGFGQTNSQPTTVKLLLEWLEVEPGNKILDVGSGSGWTTALLSRLTGPKGKVYAVEVVPQLVDFGRANCKRLGITNAEFHKAGKQLGLPRYAPYDRILVSAAAREVPQQLTGQLVPGGKMIIPVGYDVLEIEKTKDSRLDVIPHGGFAFVPLIYES
jgi:protein-L-isoaspartate(D-aspartate) O-methyltransferase